MLRLRHAFLGLLGYLLTLLLYYTSHLAGLHSNPACTPALPPTPPPAHAAHAAACAALRARGLGEYPSPPTPTAPWPHQLVNAACPKYVQNDVNPQAGLGHRLSNWLVALSAALHLNLTLLHDFAEDPGVHGGYAGWGAALGLGLGAVPGTRELAWRGAGGAEGWGLREVTLPSAGGPHLDPARLRTTYERDWAPLARNASQCHTVYRVGGDSWPYDFTTLAKGIVAGKFAAAGALGAAPGFPRAPAAAPQWDSGQVNIAVHVRKGDVYSVPEDMLARMVGETVLPAMQAQAFPLSRLAVHVFAEFSGYGVEAFPTLAALGDGGLRVAFWQGASEWAAFLHLGLADFVVTSQSGFPSMATYFSLHPLTLGFPSSNTLKHCREDIVCCYYDGRCGFAAVSRVGKRAQVLAQAEACGLLAARRERAGQ